MAATCKASPSCVEEDEVQQRDWASGLPSLAVANIAERLTVLDFVRFSAACKPWWSVLGKQIQFIPRALHFPWLMVPTNDTGVHNATRTFINLPEGRRSYNLTSPELIGKHVVSSDKGWLVLCDDQLGLSLLQPITGAHLSLPSLFTLDDFEAVRDPSTGSIVEVFFDNYDTFTIEEATFLFITKVVLSCNPSLSEEDCVAVLLYGKLELAFARPGDRAWTFIDRIPPGKYRILDILFKDSRSLLGLTTLANVEQIEFDSRTTKPRTTFLLNNIKGKEFFTMETCLGFCAGDIFAVCRVRNLIPDPRKNSVEDEMMVTKKLIIHKLHLENDSGVGRWIEIKDIKDYSLFIGYNPCIYFTAKDVAGVKENCIYCADDNGEFLCSERGRQVTRDAVVFDLKKNCYEFLYHPDDYPTYPPPIWFIPSLL